MHKGRQLWRSLAGKPARRIEISSFLAKIGVHALSNAHLGLFSPHSPELGRDRPPAPG
jgi:hypothetical protein